MLAFEALRGLEFDSVNLTPPTQLLGTWDRLSADLYVAATRARHELVVILTGEPFSELATSIRRAADSTEVLGEDVSR